MLDKKNLIELGKLTARAKSGASVAFSYNGKENFSYNELNDTLRAELNELCPDYRTYCENKNTVFALVEEVIDDILPIRVLEQYGAFAEVKQFAQGDKPVFYQKLTRQTRKRAKSFVTKVGLAGVYEVFKLEGVRSVEVPTSAWGGAAQIGFEEFLDGRVQWADLVDVIMEGLDEAVYLEIERALKGAVTNLQRANKTTQTAFNEAEMDRLLEVADAYGDKASIYCTFEFAATMLPAEGWISDEHRNTRWNNGYLGNYKNHNVIVWKQSFEDEKNEVKVIDPAFAWILPSNAEKPVKIAFEGQAQIRETENEDWSRDMHYYKKMGVGAFITNNICVYVNSSLTRQSYEELQP